MPFGLAHGAVLRMAAARLGPRAIQLAVDYECCNEVFSRLVRIRRRGRPEFGSAFQTYNGFAGLPHPQLEFASVVVTDRGEVLETKSGCLDSDALTDLDNLLEGSIEPAASDGDVTFEPETCCLVRGRDQRDAGFRCFRCSLAFTRVRIHSAQLQTS